MAVEQANPNAQELDKAFEQAMTGPAKPRAAAKTPPEVDHDAPHGRDDDGKPKAPYGYTKDGKVRRSAAGRRAKDDPDRARVGGQPAVSEAKTGTVIPPKDYTGGLMGTADGMWLVMSSAAKMPLSKVPLVGGFLPDDIEDKLGAQARIFGKSRGSLVVALNEAARHNARAARLAQKLSEGDATWVLTVASLAGPFVGASIALWKGELDAKALAKDNDAELDLVMKQISDQAEAVQAQMMQAAEQAAAEQNGHQGQPGPLAAMAG